MVNRFILPPLRDYQTELVRDQSNEIVCLSSTQVGKTFAYAAKLCAAMWEYQGPHPWWWTAPTYKQGRVGQRIMYALTKSAGIRVRGPRPPFEQNPPPTLVLSNGTSCEYRTWDNPENLMGDPIAGVVVDEAGLLNSAAHGAISTRRSFTLGPIWYIGNPGRLEGPFEKLCNKAEGENRLYRWTWRTLYEWLRKTDPDHAARYLEHIESERNTFDRREFRRLYEAEWADWNELPVYTFDRTRNQSDAVCQDQYLPLDLSVDFNVDPMAWIVGQHHQEQAWAFDEIIISGGATTVMACQEFIRRYPDRQLDINVYGDASGKSRKTSATQTDYQIMRDMLGSYYREYREFVPGANPLRSDRTNAVNAKMQAASGAVTYRIHPRCTALARDYARVSYRPGTRDFDTRDKTLTHPSDADGYRLAYLYPVLTMGEAVVATIADANFEMNDEILGAEF